jgi:hypothetical protein
VGITQSHGGLIPLEDSIPTNRTKPKSNSLTNTLFDRPPCLTKEGECDIYIVEFVHDAAKNYYERGKYGC